MLLFPQGRGGHGGTDDLRQLQGRRNGLFPAPLQYCAGDASGITLLAVVPQDTVEAILVPGVHHLIGRKSSALVHAHVERRLYHVGKAALRLVKLRRGHSQIEEHPVRPLDAEGAEDGGRVREISVDKLHLVPKGRKTPSGSLNGRLVSVDADEASRGEPGGDLKGMAAHSQRAVEIDPVRPDIQVFYTFVQQDGDMLRCLFRFFVGQNSSSSMTAAMFSGVVSRA